VWTCFHWVVIYILKFLLILYGEISGHEESYNPSVEYIPTQEEIDSYQLMYEEDRPKFIPKRYYIFVMLPFHCPLSYIV
jgi:hypothetical protein